LGSSQGNLCSARRYGPASLIRTAHGRVGGREKVCSHGKQGRPKGSTVCRKKGPSPGNPPIKTKRDPTLKLGSRKDLQGRGNRKTGKGRTVAVRKTLIGQGLLGLTTTGKKIGHQRGKERRPRNHPFFGFLHTARTTNATTKTRRREKKKRTAGACRTQY